MTINRGWRSIAAVFSFVVFGLGGIVLSIIVFPIVNLLPAESDAIKQRRVQKIIQLCFKYFIQMMKLLGLLTYQVIGVDRLKSAKLILANHPSLLDVVFMIAMIPNANCIVKGKLTKNIFTRGPIKAAGYLVNNDSDTLVDAAVEAINKGSALLVFPEGTRTTPSQALKFKRGAANIAIRAKFNVTPAIINCTPTTLTKSDKWYLAPFKKTHLTIEIKDEIDIQQYPEEMALSKRVRLLNIDLHDYFTKELEKT